MPCCMKQKSHKNIIVMKYENNSESIWTLLLGKSVLVRVNARGSSQQGKIYEYMQSFKAMGMEKKGSDLTHVFYNLPKYI